MVEKNPKKDKPSCSVIREFREVMRIMSLGFDLSHYISKMNKVVSQLL